MLTLDEVSAIVKKIKEYPIEEVIKRISYLEEVIKNSENLNDKEVAKEELDILLDFKSLYDSFQK